MRRTSFLICLTLLAATPALAAQSAANNDPRSAAPAGEPPQQGQRMAELTRELGLTAEQSAKLKAILEKQRQELQAMRASEQQSRQERLEKGRAMRNKRREELLTVLNHEQLYKFEQYMEQHRPRMRPNAGRRPGDAGGQQRSE